MADAPQAAALTPAGAVRRDLPALTGLRFFLALWVILHHLTGPGQDLEALARQLPEGLFSLIRGGFQAVTTFFVLSGFVLTRTYAATLWNRRSVVNYWIGRVARIYPVYLLSIAVMIPFIVEDHTPGKFGYVAQYFALLQGWLGPLPVGWNTPAWSLSCEMFFYALFPLSALLIRRATWRNVLLVAAASIVLTRLMWAAGVDDNVKPLVHLADFLMGIAAACAFDLLSRDGRAPSGWKLYLPGLGGAALLLAYPGALPKFLDVNSVLRPLNALALIGLAIGGGAVARFLSTRLLVYLGKSSYAMYILHVPVLWWYLRESRTFSAPVYIGIVMAVSALVYGLYEEPSNRWLRGRLRRGPAKA
ncbi:MAG: acyltransferase [Acidobacteria bacterium]|nr:acyltransferase [Acidobacteriota bacterium]